MVLPAIVIALYGATSRLHEKVQAQSFPLAEVRGQSPLQGPSNESGRVKYACGTVTKICMLRGVTFHIG